MLLSPVNAVGQIAGGPGSNRVFPCRAGIERHHWRRGRRDGQYAATIDTGIAVADVWTRAVKGGADARGVQSDEH